MSHDGEARASRVVGSASFSRPQMPPSEEEEEGEVQHQSNLVRREGTACAMPYSVQVVAPEGCELHMFKIMNEVFEMVEKTFSLHNVLSEICRINELEAVQEVVLSEAMKEVLKMAAEVSRVTRGAFEPAVAPLLQHYRFAAERFRKLHSHNEKEEEEEKGSKVIEVWKTLLARGFGEDGGDGNVSKKVDAMKEFCKFSSFRISQDGKTLKKTHSNAMLDLNGIAKGWGVDTIVKRISSEVDNVSGVFFDWAGDIKVFGTHPTGRPWRVVVFEPPPLDDLDRAAENSVPENAMIRFPETDKRECLAVLELRSGQAVATSGDYEQAIWHKGLFSHVLNPKTCRLSKLSAQNVSQAVVISSSCMVADALATAALAIGDPSQARIMLDPLRTGFHQPISDYILYAREGPRIIRLTVPGLESDVERAQRLKPLLEAPEKPHVIVVGAGLAGMSAAIEAADAGAMVTVLERESRTGGNSAKATSGINGWGTETQARLGVADEERYFERDTFRSGRDSGGKCNDSLVRTLSTKSASAIHWLQHRFGLHLDALSQLGGHSVKRTHRIPPDENGRPVPIGFTIMKTLAEAVDRDYKGRILTRTGCLVKDLVHEVHPTSRAKEVSGVVLEHKGSEETLQADAIVVATGGFGCDQSEDGLLMEFRHDLKGVPTTNGTFARGDGIKFGRRIGANLIDMDKVQLHPTGFIDPEDPHNPTKFLAPEAVRGSGGILVNQEGLRFVDELDLRSVVSKAIQQHCQCFPETEQRFAFVLLSKEAQELFGLPALSFYKAKGLFQDCADLEDCAKRIIGCDVDVLRQTIRDYREAIEAGYCKKTKKMVFPSSMSEVETNFIIARVTPSIHYCMGGLQISAAGEVQELLPKRVVGRRRHIRRLFAAGEVTGGVHGGNRLGGNSLLECVVFGRIAGERAATINGRSELSNEWVNVVMREIRNTDREFGKNTREIRFNLQGGLTASGLAVGQYIAIRGTLDGNTLQGYFSPVTRPSDEGVIGILCRFDQKGGPIYDLLDIIRPGSTLQMKACGGLALDFTQDGIYIRKTGRRVRRLGLLAGGTGVAPMVQLCREYVHHTQVIKNRDELVPLGLNLLFAAEEEDDLAFYKVFEDLKANFPEHFRFYTILNKPPLGWTEGVGFVKPKNIKKHIFFPPADDQLIVICGPPVFEQVMVKTLNDLGFSDHHFYSYSQED